MARGPLDKRRLRSDTADFFLRKAMDDFLWSLKRGDMIMILVRELREMFAVCTGDEFTADQKPEIFCHNLDVDEVKNILKKTAENSGTGVNPMSIQWQINLVKNTAQSFPAVIINSNSLRITASVENAAMKLLGDKRAELASALLGGGALND